MSVVRTASKAARGRIVPTPVDNKAAEKKRKQGKTTRKFVVNPAAMIALPPLAQGTTFAGEYRVLELLSHTNHLALYGATHVPTGEVRVLELLFTPIVPGAAFRDRFVRAAMEPARAASPIIPRVLSAGVDGPSQVPFVAMEAFRGELLAAAALRGGGLPVPDALTVLGQVASGLVQLHAAGLVHGGLRPEAIVLTADPTQRLGIKLLNAALAKTLGDARVAAAPSAVPGDPAWVAPEQIEGEEPTPLSDVYSFALLAFHVLTGQRVWRTNVEAQIAREATKDPLPIPTMRAYELGRGGTLPTSFDGWFARCAARAKHERFPTVEVAFLELQGVFQRAASQYTGSIQPMTSGHVVLPPRKSSGSGLLVALGLVGGLVAFGGLASVGYYAVKQYQTRAMEAKLEAEKRVSEIKTNAAEVAAPGATPEAAPPGDQSVPSIDINALPNRGNANRREDSRRESDRGARVEARPSEVAPSAPAAGTGTGTGTAAAGSPAALAEAAPSSTTNTKLQVIDLAPGKGKAVRTGDKITVRYTGKRQADGVVYDSAHANSTGFSFTLGQGRVTKGWEVGIPGMKVGGKRRLVVPPQLGYGEKGLGSAVPPNSTLIFDIELVSAD